MRKRIKILGSWIDGLRGKIALIYLLLIVMNLAAWTWALIAFRTYPLPLGAGFLAYAFGLKHAVDADHIAAIDNVTRKLMHQGKRPVAVGFFFSLGHSTIVFLLSAALALTATSFKGQFGLLRGIGGVIGMTVSASFLFMIGFANIIVFIVLYRTFRRVKNGGDYIEEDFNQLMANRGLIARATRSLFGLIGKSWHMYLLGFLFGLGFDTATEIGLLGASAAEAAKGMPLWTILVFPALFTASMSLVDTTDGVLMLGAYGWAFLKPVRKIYYNMTLTFVSIIIALGVGSIEILGLISTRLHQGGGLSSTISYANAHFAAIGLSLVAFFAVSWIVSKTIYRMRGRRESGACDCRSSTNAAA